MVLDAVVLLVFRLIGATLVSSAMADLILTLICGFEGFRSAMDNELLVAQCVGDPIVRPTWQLMQKWLRGLLNGFPQSSMNPNLNLEALRLITCNIELPSLNSPQGLDKDNP